MELFWGLSSRYNAKSFSSVQLLSHVQLFATPRTAACQASLSITNSRSLLKLMSIELVMPSSHLILCHPLLLLLPIPPNIRVFSNESTLHMRWPKYWSFSFSFSLSNGHLGLISFRMDWYLTKKGKQIKNMNYRNEPNRNFGVEKYSNQNDKLTRVAQWEFNQLKTVSLRLYSRSNRKKKK